MNKEKVGQVTEEEKKEILKLFERKLALNELISNFNNPFFGEKEKNELYEKIVSDMGETKFQYEMWWQKTALKYKWKNIQNSQWNIDFTSGEIFLVT